MANHPSYRILKTEATAEIEVKKSRFIGQTFIVHSMDEVQEKVRQVEKNYWDARHNCYACILGDRSEISKCSDNGEPSGTAGKPILEVLSGEGLTNTLLIVTRYFGGTLLGTGGLVRAYTQAAKEAITASGTGLMRYGTRMLVETDYNLVTPLQHYFRNHETAVLEERYAEKAGFVIFLPEEDGDVTVTDLTELSQGSARFEKLGEGFECL